MFVLVHTHTLFASWEIELIKFPFFFLSPLRTTFKSNSNLKQHMGIWHEIIAFPWWHLSGFGRDVRYNCWYSWPLWKGSVVSDEACRCAPQTVLNVTDAYTEKCINLRNHGRVQRPVGLSWVSLTVCVVCPRQTVRITFKPTKNMNWKERDLDGNTYCITHVQIYGYIMPK